jgi:hypothetical protein
VISFLLSGVERAGFDDRAADRRCGDHHSALPCDLSSFMICPLAGFVVRG